MTKNGLYLFIIFSLIIIFPCKGNTVLTKGVWTVKYNTGSKGADIFKNAESVVNGLSVSYKLDGKLVSSRDYSNRSLEQVMIKDVFGKGAVFKITYKQKGLPVLVQSIYVYENEDYILTDFTLENKGGEISSNYMAPVVIENLNPILPRGESRALFVPFDNDCWVRYQSHPLTFDKLRSYEVSAIFENESRRGLVVGSVEHDFWKTAVDMTTQDHDNIKSLNCYGGVADSLTRDSKEHGSLRGKKIKSPKIFIGLFSDWRKGMETYGLANAAIAPPREWNKALPFGWNSWGALQFNLTYAKALEVSDYFKEKLQNHNFQNTDKTVIIGLDSGWNSFNEDELKSFVRKCKENGQVAGIYWTPFTDWGKNPDRPVNNAPSYNYKDIYLYANGKPQELDGAFAIDPTHPAVEEAMKDISDLFRRCGFEYVKMDFMTHGAMEADKWYRSDIQTGIQAYNYGLDLMTKYFGDMFINLSISPIFPANYAQSRRIACDAWNKIKDTEYTMNAVSYGWWIDNIYRFNDADHIVLREATDGENRARVTSAAITGLYIAGDDFSKAGPDEAKQKAEKYLTNADVNAIAKGETFMPVEGNGEKSENQFVHTDAVGNVYYALFNFSEQDAVHSVKFDRIGLDRSVTYKAKELWSGKDIDLDSALRVPAKDVLLIKISK